MGFYSPRQLSACMASRSMRERPRRTVPACTRHCALPDPPAFVISAATSVHRVAAAVEEAERRLPPDLRALSLMADGDGIGYEHRYLFRNNA